MITMRQSIRVSVPSSFRTVEEVLSGLCELEAAFVAAGDRRGVFTTAYLATTMTMSDWLERRRFLQNDLVARYVVAFGNLYREAIASYEAGLRSAVPGAWRQSFDACRFRRTSVFQDLLLGINAHINHDLAHAVIRAGLDVDCDRCYQDHTRMNEALRLATPLVRKRVAANYSRWINVANWLLGRTIDATVAGSFARARENAWTWATALSRARSTLACRRVEVMIDRRAELSGQKILDRRRSPAKTLALLHEIKSQFAAPIAPVANLERISTLCPASIG